MSSIWIVILLLYVGALSGLIVSYRYVNRVRKIFPEASQRLRIANIISTIAGAIFFLMLISVLAMGPGPHTVSPVIFVIFVLAFLAFVIGSLITNYYVWKQRFAEWRTGK